MWNKIKIIGFFGFFGAISRSIFYELLQNSMESHIIVFLINILGSFLLGFGLEYGKTSKTPFYSQNYKEILSGFVGSFTTFAMLEYNLYEISDMHLNLLPIFWIILEISLGITFFKFGLILAEFRNVSPFTLKEEEKVATN